MSIIVVDTETSTYAHDPRSSILEVGLIVIQNFEIVANYSSLVRPKYPLGDWAEKALEITKLDKKVLEHALPANEVWVNIVGWLKEFKPIESVYAWNVTFDKKAFSNTFSHTDVLPWGECLMRMASQHKRGNRKGYALKEASKDYGIEFCSEQHRALEDARVAAEIFIRIQREQQFGLERSISTSPSSGNGAITVEAYTPNLLT